MHLNIFLQRLRNAKKSSPKGKKTKNIARENSPNIAEIPNIVELGRRVATNFSFLLKLLGSLIGLLVTASAVWDIAWNSRPKISVLQSDFSGKPFTVPFAVENPSHFFSFHNIRLDCNANNMNFGRNDHFDRLEVVGQAYTTNEIKPGDRHSYTCPIDFPAGSLLSTQLELKLYYSTWGMTREPVIQVFTWDPRSVPPRWIEGDVN